MTNTAFDAVGHDYSASYAETQQFSARFVDWSRGLARTLTDRHGLRDTPVPEIGCERADFLRLMCEATGATGVGIDPSLRTSTWPGRSSRFAGGSSQRTRSTAYGLILCRHTLEHVHNVHGFLRLVHGGLAGRTTTPVFFEVPDTMRILRESFDPPTLSRKHLLARQPIAAA